MSLDPDRKAKQRKVSNPFSHMPVAQVTKVMRAHGVHMGRAMGEAQEALQISTNPHASNGNNKCTEISRIWMVIERGLHQPTINLE